MKNFNNADLAIIGNITIVLPGSMSLLRTGKKSNFKLIKQECYSFLTGKDGKPKCIKGNVPNTSRDIVKSKSVSTIEIPIKKCQWDWWTGIYSSTYYRDGKKRTKYLNLPSRSVLSEMKKSAVQWVSIKEPMIKADFHVLDVIYAYCRQNQLPYYELKKPKYWKVELY